MKNRFATLCLCVLLCVSFGCASDYVWRTRAARQAFIRGQHEDAIRWYERKWAPRRDRLLYLLDAATILHSARRYPESILLFEKALDLAEKLSGGQVASKTAATLLANDNFIPYQGAPFELLLVHTYQVLNFLGMGELDKALIEVRRLHNRFADFLGNAFTTYLAALVWETNGLLNDAYIDYKVSHRLGARFPGLAEVLLTGAYRLGFWNEYQRWRGLFGRAYQRPPVGQGELIVILEEGRVPEKRSTEAEYDLQLIPIPYYQKPARTLLGITVTAGKQSVRSTPLYRIDEAVYEQLADQKEAIVARALARLITHEGAAIAVAEKVDKNLGVALSLAFHATNRADLRSWLTLPRSLQIAQFRLPAGQYSLSVGRKSVGEITVSKGRKTFFLTRS